MDYKHSICAIVWVCSTAAMANRIEQYIGETAKTGQLEQCEITSQPLGGGKYQITTDLFSEDTNLKQIEVLPSENPVQIGNFKLSYQSEIRIGQCTWEVSVWRNLETGFLAEISYSEMCNYRRKVICENLLLSN